MQYAEHRYPCLDKYSKGKGFVPNAQILQVANALTASDSNKSIDLEYTRLKAAFLIKNLWDPVKFPVLKIAFLDGTQKQKQWVQKVIDENLQPLMTKIKFQWDVPPRESHIRVSFKLPRQAWSLLGVDALNVSSSEPTMNLGWIDDDTDFDSPKYKGTGAVVIHEFGHAIGMIHEHQNPIENPIEWNKPVVYEDLRRTNGWDRTQVDFNMFKKYGDANLCDKAKQIEDPLKRRVEMQNYCAGDLINGSTYDVRSIMHYFYPATWILKGPKEIPVNTGFSNMDKEWIRKYYGNNEDAGIIPTLLTAPLIAPTSTDPTLNGDGESMYNTFLFKMAIVIVIAIVIMMLVYVLIKDKSNETII